jgi:hypothetical protein
VIPFQDSEELVDRITGAKLIAVPDGDHSLNDYLLDGFVKCKTPSGQTASINPPIPQKNNLKRIVDELLSCS